MRDKHLLLLLVFQYYKLICNEYDSSKLCKTVQERVQQCGYFWKTSKDTCKFLNDDGSQLCGFCVLSFLLKLGKHAYGTKSSRCKGNLVMTGVCFYSDFFKIFLSGGLFYQFITLWKIECSISMNSSHWVCLSQLIFFFLTIASFNTQM